MSSVPLHPPPPPANPNSGPPPLPSQAAFSGDRDKFFLLVARGAALELVTAGFYRFWLTTDIRRHLWSNTQVDGDAVEYTGRGKELLIGFLFALAILVPVYIAYFLVTVEFERRKGFASLPLLAFFYLFGQFAIYRARRYRLSRTVWRGVRFWMNGSGWAYAARAALWALFTLFTLGLLLPWREAALERYKMRHCHYGDLQGRFDGRGWDFFKRGCWVWLGGFASLVLLALSKYIPPAPLIVVVAAPFLYALFKAVEWRWWVSGIRFGEVRFESKLSHDDLIDLYWKVVGWFLLAAVVLTIYVVICAGVIGGPNFQSVAKLLVAGNLKNSAPMLVLIGLGYLAFILGVNIVMRVYLMGDLWARVIASTTLYNVAMVTNVSAVGDMSDAVGEGLADGLDVAGF